MWFKNLIVYQMQAILDRESLPESLAEKPFTECGPLQPYSVGWVPPLGDDKPYTHSIGEFTMLCLQYEEKILPAASINQKVAKAAAKIEKAEGRKVRGKEKANLKDEILMQVMPNALTKMRKVYAYLSKDHIIIDATTASKGEEFTGFLRETLGSLPITPLTCEIAPSAVMTEWLTNQSMPRHFEPDNTCVLKDPGDDAATIRARHQDVYSDEVKGHLDGGKLVISLGLTFDDLVSFSLNEKLEVKKLNFLDAVLDQSDQEEIESADQQFDSDFAIMTREITWLLDALDKSLAFTRPF